jgi:hypothetical protein
MAATAQQIADMAAAFAREVYVSQEQLANADKDDLKAAAEAAYNWIETNTAAFKAALAEPFKTVATNKQKAELFRIAAEEAIKVY